MRLRARSKDHKICLVLPTRILLNRLTIQLFSKIAEKYSNHNFELTPVQAALAARAIRQSKAVLARRPLIYVSSANGEEVEIYL